MNYGIMRKLAIAFGVLFLIVWCVYNKHGEYFVSAYESQAGFIEIPVEDFHTRVGR